jgi:beta-N-acetylhexosaminidase
VLHCNGDMAEMVAIASQLRPLSAAAEVRVARGLAQKRKRVPFDRQEAAERVGALLGPSP